MHKNILAMQLSILLVLIKQKTSTMMHFTVQQNKIYKLHILIFRSSAKTSKILFIDRYSENMVLTKKQHQVLSPNKNKLDLEYENYDQDLVNSSIGE